MAKRVRGFSLREEWWERAQAFAMSTDWPARLAERMGAVAPVLLRQTEIRSAHSLGDATALRIGFASDFHAGPLTPSRLIDQAIGALAAANPDIVLLGGDFVSFRVEYVDRVCARLASLAPPLGVFAVLGNHDLWTNASTVAAALERAGVHMLTNRAVRLPAPWNGVELLGLDDHQSGDPQLPADMTSDSCARVVLMHAPSGMLDLGDTPFVLALAGHTHGGQLATSSGKPIVLPAGALSRTYHRGCYDIPQHGTLLVSCGVGMSGLPFRWNVPAETHMVTLRHQP
ncbi:MAG TPA: metallophosphoesterase [Gemmatimonas sp.]|nr:metallophosphoesterase [Gemmatimonas sp.]